MEEEDFSNNEINPKILSPSEMDSVSQISSNKRQREKIRNSSVWDHFKRDKVKGNVACAHCEKTFSNNTSTGSLLKHYQKLHSQNFQSEEESESDIKSIDNGTKITDFYKKINSKKSKLDIPELLFNWIISSQQPWTVVEEESFRTFIRALNKEFIMTSSKSLANKLESTYQEKNKLVQEYLIQLPSKISLTFDGWTSMSQEPFLGITGFFHIRFYYSKVLWQLSFGGI